MFGRLINTFDSVSGTIGRIQLFYPREIIEAKILCPVVHCQILDWGWKAERADFGGIGKMHHVRIMIAVAVGPVREKNFTEVARHTGNSCGFDAIV